MRNILIIMAGVLMFVGGLAHAFLGWPHVHGDLV